MLSPTRRHFMKAAASAATITALHVGAADSSAKPSQKLKLGFDNFSIRELKWKAAQLIDYAAEQKADALLISDLDSYDSHEPAYLKEIGKRSSDKGIEFHAGTLCICPTSTKFDKRRGTAEEHLRTLLTVAQHTGAKVARCVLGFGEDRRTPGGIEARIADTIAELKKVRSQALDHGIKIGVENHAGDMQAWELETLIKGAGEDFVGATIDSGNATWTLEEPNQNLEILAPYIVSSGIRDSMVWNSEDGITVQWTAMGDGVVDFPRYFQRWAQVAADKPVILEIISGFPRNFPLLKADFWESFRKTRPNELAQFMALPRKGKAIPAGKPGDPQYQKAELERSLKHCREVLGLGRK